MVYVLHFLNRMYIDGNFKMTYSIHNRDLHRQCSPACFITHVMPAVKLRIDN